MSPCLVMVALSTNTLLWKMACTHPHPRSTRWLVLGACSITVAPPKIQSLLWGLFCPVTFGMWMFQYWFLWGSTKRLFCLSHLFLLGRAGETFFLVFWNISWAMIPYEPSSLKYLEHGEDKGDNYKRWYYTWCALPEILYCCWFWDSTPYYLWSDEGHFE